jgi:3-phenylpropionate/trans-cinnamate dioxygenase ferredoxin subunit
LFHVGFAVRIDGLHVRALAHHFQVITHRQVGQEVFAVADTCTHSEASLSEGETDGFKIECWLHGAEFDLRTGQALTLPANIALETFPVKIDGNSVTVEI